MLDEYDRKILSILQADGRISKRALAEAINLSSTPCWERFKRLENQGFITGYRAQINYRKILNVTEMIVEITLSNHKASDFKVFESYIASIDEICECWAIGGGADYMMKLMLSNVDEYQQLMEQLLDADIGIEKYFGYIVTKSIKSTLPKLI